jgi:hypothetical protein
MLASRWARRRIAVYMCHVPDLPRFVWVEDGEERVVGWIGTRCIPALAAMAAITPTIVDNSTRARTIIDRVLQHMNTAFHEDFEKVISDASETASKVFGY